jgi:hypothetical protein
MVDSILHTESCTDAPQKRRKRPLSSHLSIKFVKKAERPAPSTYPQPSTSSAPSVPLPADDKPDDVMPVSFDSSPTN